MGATDDVCSRACSSCDGAPDCACGCHSRNRKRKPAPQPPADAHVTGDGDEADVSCTEDCPGCHDHECRPPAKAIADDEGEVKASLSIREKIAEEWYAKLWRQVPTVPDALYGAVWDAYVAGIARGRALGAREAEEVVRAMSYKCVAPSEAGDEIAAAIARRAGREGK